MRSSVYPYEYMDDWGKFIKTSLHEKEHFDSNLNMEDVTNADSTYTKMIYKNFEMKDLAEYHDLYVQSNKLLLADVFKNFRNMCYEIYELDPAWFSTATGLSWQIASKKTKTIRCFN